MRWPAPCLMSSLLQGQRGNGSAPRIEILPQQPPSNSAGYASGGAFDQMMCVSSLKFSLETSFDLLSHLALPAWVAVLHLQWFCACPLLMTACFSWVRGDL
jgi:hypothetical protein